MKCFRVRIWTRGSFQSEDEGYGWVRDGLGYISVRARDRARVRERVSVLVKVRVRVRVVLGLN